VKPTLARASRLYFAAAAAGQVMADQSSEQIESARCCSLPTAAGDRRAHGRLSGAGLLADVEPGHRGFGGGTR
jgi:hypothetical protein